MHEDTTRVASAKLDFICDHRELYLQSGGSEGHIVSLPAPGRHWFTPHCLLRTIGRGSGNVNITPLIYGCTGGEVIVAASNGGADRHPAWYLNLLSSEHAQFQVATEAFLASWREPVPDERDAMWKFMLGMFPGYEAYQRATSRLIPLIAMRPIERIPIFRSAS